MQCRKNIRKAILPLLANIIIVLIFWLVPIYDIWMTLNFKPNSTDYNKIIQMVDDGRIPPDDKSFTNLPPGYHHLSPYGYIFIHKGDNVTRVFFHTSIGYSLGGKLRSVFGYMYRSNGTPPPPYFRGGDWVLTKRIKPRWFLSKYERSSVGFFDPY